MNEVISTVIGDALPEPQVDNTLYRGPWPTLARPPEPQVDNTSDIDPLPMSTPQTGLTPLQPEETLGDIWRNARPREKAWLALFPGLILTATIAGGIFGYNGGSRGVDEWRRSSEAKIGGLVLCRDYIQTVPGPEPKIILVDSIPTEAQQSCGIDKAIENAKAQLKLNNPNQDPPFGASLPSVVGVVPDIRLPREDAVTARIEQLRADAKDNGFLSITGATVGGAIIGFVAGTGGLIGAAFILNRIPRRRQLTEPEQVNE